MGEFGYSKDSLRQLVGLAGEFLGTTDAQTETNKTINTTDNNLTATSQAAGDILVNNATKFVRLARGAANLPLKVNSAGTNVEYGVLPVAGGGIGAATLTGVVIGNGAGAMTAKTNPVGAFLADSDTQVITGAKTFQDTTLVLRNPANLASLTFHAPAVTSDIDYRFYEPYVYLIVNEGTTVYAKNGLTAGIVYSGSNTTAASTTTVIQNAINNMTAGRTWKERIKLRGTFTLTTLTIPSYTILDLSDAIITQNSAQNTNLFINNDTSGGNTNIEIDGGVIDGNKAGQSADGVNYNTRNTINFTKCTNSIVHDCTIQNSNSSGIYLNDCVITHVYNNRILSPRKIGLYHDGTSAGSNTFITNNYIFSCGENFIANQNASDCYISGNLCDTCTTNGINSNGLRGHIVSNIVKTSGRMGITVGGEDAGGAGDYSDIIGNLVWQAKGGGIYTGVAQGNDYVTIIGNKCVGHPTLQLTEASRSFGIRMTGNYAIIEANQVIDWGRSGIYCQGTSATGPFDSRVLKIDRLQIRNNLVVNNGQFDATETTAGFKSGISLKGLSAETAYVTKVKITGNICYDNIDYGIILNNTTDTLIEDNDLVGNVLGAISIGANNV